jgi:adenylate kinase family enzyme
VNPQTFILMGRSGSGKGTQSKLLEAYIREKDAEKHPFFYVETGARFRHFIQGERLSNRLAAQLYKDGKRQPDFLAIWVWGHTLLENMTGKEHLILDGTPRSYDETVILDTAMKFFKREKPIVIHLNVSRRWSIDHLLARGRMDDKTEEDINRRLDWFDKDVIPAFEFFKNNPEYRLIEINGEQSIEKVHADLIAAL